MLKLAHDAIAHNQVAEASRTKLLHQGRSDAIILELVHVVMSFNTISWVLFLNNFDDAWYSLNMKNFAHSPEK